jgi:hypothetical protein
MTTDPVGGDGFCREGCSWEPLPGRRLGAGAVDIVLEPLPPAAGSSWRLWLVSRLPVFIPRDQVGVEGR